MSELSIRIRKLQDNGTTFKANPNVLELGGVGSAKVDTLRFEVPEEWKRCVISLHVKRLSGTLPDPQLLDEANCVVVDRRWTLEKQGTWMLLAVGDDGYVAMTKPGQYTCYETIDTDSTTETIEPSIYEQFVAQVKQYAEQAKASKESASEAEAGAKQAFEDTKETKESALTDIAAARQKALDDTETARTGALEDIEQARTAALDDVADSTKTATDAANEATKQANAAAGSAQAAADSEAAAGSSAEAAEDSAARAKADADKVSAMVTMDKTLSIEGAPADAKATGDAINALREETVPLLDGKSDVGHTHDDRYYRKEETDNLVEINTGKLEARLSVLELKYGTNITANPWSVAFDTLSGVTVTGVWNKNAQRIDF